jgi:transposase
VTASAIAASVQDVSAVSGPREFAAFLGLTPRQNSSGGKEQLNGAEFAPVSCRRCGPLLPPKVPLRFQESDGVGGRPGGVILLRLRQGTSMGAYPDAV